MAARQGGERQSNREVDPRPRSDNTPGDRVNNRSNRGMDLDKRGRTDATRGRGGVKANNRPDYVRAFLEGLDYPASKHALIRLAQSHGAPTDVISALERIQEREYRDPVDLSQALESTAL